MRKTSSKTKSLQKRLNKLIQEGCVIETDLKGTLYVDLLAKAMFTGRGLFWCGVFPQDQHNCHFTRFDETPSFDSADVLSIKGKTRIVPIDRSTPIFAGDIHAMHARWKKSLRNQERKRRFNQFLIAKLVYGLDHGESRAKMMVAQNCFKPKTALITNIEHVRSKYQFFGAFPLISNLGMDSIFIESF